MSHFATLVIHKEGADIDEILAPFCETDEEFFEFYDFTDKLKKEYSTVTVKRVKMPDGKYYNYGDKIFAKKVSKEEYYKNQKCPFDYQDSWGYRLCYKKDCPLKEKYRHCTLSECDKLIAFNKFIMSKVTEEKEKL